jgi:hypothetical protein
MGVQRVILFRGKHDPIRRYRRYGYQPPPLVKIKRKHRRGTHRPKPR